MRKAACFVVCLCLMIELVAGCAFGEVAIDNEHFPDSTFRAYVMTYFDKDGDGILSDDEIASATSIIFLAGGRSGMLHIGIFGM